MSHSRGTGRLLWIPLLVALGLGSRRPGVPEIIRIYAGDVLWGALLFAFYTCLRPSARTLCLWAWAVATTELIELSQLYQEPWIVDVRETRVGGLLLGHGFSWSDVVCVAIGATGAAFVDSLRPRTSTHVR